MGKKVMNLAADSASVENGDILLKIFLGLTWRLIFQMRLVSKQWLLILSDPNFISAWMKINDFNPWMTIIYDTVTNYVTSSSTNKHSEYISAMFTLDFVTFVHPPHKLLILSASNNGLLLCSTTKLRHQTTLYVCNPLSRKFVMLPEVLTYKVSVFLGFICGSSSTSCRMGYKVYRIPQFFRRKRNFEIEIYSSGLDKWMSYEVLCALDVSMPECLQKKVNMIEIGGVLYWNEGPQGNRIIALDIKNNKTEDTGTNSCERPQCRVIVLPEEVVKPGGEKCLIECKGSIACIHCDLSQFSIWVLLDDDTNNVWILPFHFVRPYKYTLDYIFRPLAFDSTTQNVVILEIFANARTYHVCTYNIETGKFKLNRVANSPNNAPQFIKAFALPLLPTPICATRPSS